MSFKILKQYRDKKDKNNDETVNNNNGINLSDLRIKDGLGMHVFCNRIYNGIWKNGIIENGHITETQNNVVLERYIKDFTFDDELSLTKKKYNVTYNTKNNKIILTFDNLCHFNGYYICEKISHDGYVKFNNDFIFRGEFNNGVMKNENYEINDYCKMSVYINVYFNLHKFINYKKENIHLIFKIVRKYNDEGVYVYSLNTSNKLIIKKIILPNGDIYQSSYGIKLENFETYDNIYTHVQSGNGTIYYKNKDIYYGQWKDGKKCGTGIINYANGNKYEGEFNDDKKNGRGKMEYINNIIYDGQWTDDLYYGFGTLYKNNILIENGYYVNNILLHDKNKVKIKTTFSENINLDDIIKIIYKNNIPHGNLLYDNATKKYKIFYNNNDYYYGDITHDICKEQLTNEIINGKGIMTYDDGSIYEGEWINGNFNGQGKMIYKNGDIYNGDWKDNKANGKGKMVYNNGNVYDGDWKDNKANGHGKMIYKNGDVYEGEWKNDKANGKGVMIFSSGHIFEATWENDLGKGQIKIQNAQIVDLNPASENYRKLVHKKDILIEGKFINNGFFGTCFDGIYIYMGMFYIVSNNKNTKEVIILMTRVYVFFDDNLVKGIMLYICDISEKNGFYNSHKTDYNYLLSSYTQKYKDNSSVIGFYNITINDNIQNIICENNIITKKFVRDKYYQDTCSLCFEKNNFKKLFSLCTQEKCNVHICHKCIQTYYNKKKVIDDNILKCIFCRNYISINIFRLLFVKILIIFKTSKIYEIYNNIKCGKIYYVCNLCKNLDSLDEKIECNDNVLDAKYLCKKCADIYPIHIKKCPHCNIDVARRDTRLDGCHHMTCKNCFKYWCWFCLSKLKRDHTWICEVNGCNN